VLLPSLIANASAQEKPFVVVLDAGHGGHDSGNRGNGYYEKKIALNIALKIGAQLEKNPAIKVIYTRKKDVFVDLIERANIANKADADLFISIHCDAFTSSRAFGAGTFVLGLHENERNFKVAQKENSVIV
jgi:N-acetylmuramoyl-L-alanine amidase